MRLGSVALAGVCALLFLVPRLVGQTRPDTSTTPSLEANVLEGLAETEGGEALADHLGELLARGLDLNRASEAELAQIPALSPLLARSIVAYRDSVGAFASLPELQRVPGITHEIYAALHPYLRLGDVLERARRSASRFPSWPTRQEWRSVEGLVIHRFGQRLETARGYSEGQYTGSPARVYTRLRLTAADRLHLNLTLEKDPGEAFEWRPEDGTYGYDYLSASFTLEDVGRIRAAVAGDFTVSAGQGLVLWRSSALGKSREVTRGLHRVGSGVRAYGSPDENRFFRGVASTLLVTPDLAVTAFYSRRSLDATLLVPDTGSVGALGTSGLHRTQTERQRKDAVGAEVAGGVAEFGHGRVRLGAAVAATRFDHPLQPRPAPDAAFDLRGRSTRAGSVFGHLYAGPLTAFGEVAATDRAAAFVGGVEYAAERLGEIVVLARHYPADFISLYGYAFGERAGATRNESGVYVGIRLQPRRTLLVQAYADTYRFPWLRFNVPRPTTGSDWLFSLTHMPRRWLRHDLTFRTEIREESAPAASPLGGTIVVVRPETRQSLRWQGQYVFSRQLTLRTRLEGVRFATEGSSAHGLLVYQDVRVQPTAALTLEARLALYDTDDYAARVYAYEYDVRYGFSVPAFYGRGARQYLLARWRLRAGLDLEARYAQTRREDVATLGSGLDETPGNLVREVKAQLVWRW